MTSGQDHTWTGLHHVRIPVADLAVARTFWQDTFDYKWEFDFPGEGTGPRASALRHPRGGPRVVLWDVPTLAAATAGFTILGIGLPTTGAVIAMRDRLDARGVAHGGIQDAFVEVKLPEVRTPDGAFVGFYVQPDGTS